MVIRVSLPPAAAVVSLAAALAAVVSAAPGAAVVVEAAEQPARRARSMLMQSNRLVSFRNLIMGITSPSFLCVVFP